MYILDSFQRSPNSPTITNQYIYYKSAKNVTVYMKRERIQWCIITGTNHAHVQLASLKNTDTASPELPFSSSPGVYASETGRCSKGNGFSARHSSREHGYYELLGLGLVIYKGNAGLGAMCT